MIFFRNFVSVLAAITLGGGLHCGCHSQPAVRPATGAARFKIIEPRVRPDDDPIQGAEPVLPLAMPVYPPAALKVRHNGVVVSAHVAVDRTGRVQAVTPSLIGFSSPGPLAGDFWAAVEAAVRQWRFRPAQAHAIEPVNAGNERMSSKVLRLEPVEAAFDVAFTFTPTGEVLPVR